MVRLSYLIRIQVFGILSTHQRKTNKRLKALTLATLNINRDLRVQPNAKAN